MANGNGESKTATATIPTQDIPEAEVIDVMAPDRAKQALAMIRREELMGLDMLTFASAAVNSGFFTVESASEVIVKVLLGRDMGISATASLRHIYVHKGHIGLQSELMSSRIKASGVYDYEIIRSDDNVCELRFKQLVRGDWVELNPTISFTIEEARKAKLIKSDSAWETYPSDLLFARAISRGTRRHCPHIWGQHTVYTPEEAKAAASVIQATATVVRPEGLTAESIKDATTVTQNDAPAGSNAPPAVERKPDAPSEAPAAQGELTDLSKF